MRIDSNEFQNIQAELGTNFHKFCTIKLLPNKEGLYFYSPQGQYNNVDNYPLLPGVDNETEFCKFKPNLPKGKGLYIWVTDNEIIYIGESVELRSRFNSQYGHISPRNCYKGGRSTNVKMNKVVVSLYKNNKTIDLYVYQTEEHKRLELELLNRINTIYNVKNN